MEPDTSSGRATTADRLAYLGSAFLVLYLALVLVPWAFLVAGIDITGWMVLLALPAAAAALHLLADDDRFRTTAGTLGVALAVFLVGCLVALAFYDSSVDGRWYHQNAVLALSDGWNPISNADPGFLPGFPFVRSYPKAFWIASASLHELVGSVEIGKALHFLPLGASFALTLSLLIRFEMRTSHAVAAAGLAAANPIWILESLSFYVDGQVAALLLTALVTGIWIIWFSTTRIAVAALLMSLVLLVNLKFTGLFYSGLILLGLGAVLLWQRRAQDLTRLIAWSATTLVVAVGVVGFNPYVQNYLDFDSPFYPVFGEGSVDFITENTPANLRGEPQLVQLYYGVFGKPANPIDSDIELALPFAPASLSVAYPYTGPGARSAGLGPLFSGALVLAMAGLIWLSLRERRREVRLLVGLTVLFLAMTVVAHPEGWWARYTPQLWLVPVTIIVAAWATGSRREIWLGGLVGVVLVVNLGYVIKPYVESNLEFTRDVNRMYEPFVDTSEVMAVYLSEWSYQHSTAVQMAEAGVAFVEYESVASLPCSSPLRLANGAGSYCLVGSDGGSG